MNMIGIRELFSFRKNHSKYLKVLAEADFLGYVFIRQ